MDHFFLFTKHIDDIGCLCLKISQEGELIVAPAQRNFDEIKALQEGCSTFVIETAASASILSLDLPWLPERKARIAIPYALEDKVAQSLEELHFSFDKLRYQNQQYLVVVTSKQRIRYLMTLLDEKEVNFDLITLDWFAVPPHEFCISESVLLVNNQDFNGALSEELALSYIKKHPFNQLHVFQDSEIATDDSTTKSEGYSHTWLAQRIQKAKPLNLCQGEMVHANTFNWIKKGYQLAGALCLVWLVSLLLVNTISLYLINKKTANIDKQIAVIYHEFFPEAKQVISPKFRISQLLGSGTSESQSHFWFLLDQFAKTIGESKMTIEQLRYQSKTLSVTLISSDFASLEQLENKLKIQQLKVKRTQASTREQHVVDTLELS